MNAGSSRVRRLVAVFSAVFVLSAGIARAQDPGDRYGDRYLDATFAADGEAIFGRAGRQLANDSALLPDGTLVTVGRGDATDESDAEVVWIGPDGSLENRIDVDLGGADTANGVVVQPDGKIVVAATSTNRIAQTNHFFVFRLVDHELDETFGIEGLSLIDFGGSARASDVALDEESIIAVGGAGSPGTPLEPAIARLDQFGTLDPSFGDGGRLVIKRGAGPILGPAHRVLVEADGNILIGPLRTFAVMRLLPTGALDMTFGGDGLGEVPSQGCSLSTSFKHDLALERDGRVILLGQGECDGWGDTALGRLTAGGEPDATFWSNGLIVVSLALSTNEAGALAIDPFRRIVVTGWASDPFEQGVMIARFQPNGAPDISLNPEGSSPGTFFTPTADGASGGATGLLLLPDGRYLVSGFVQTPNDDDVLAQRYMPWRHDDGTTRSGLASFGWYSLGGSVVGAPSIAETDFGAAAVVARGADNALWLHRIYEDGTGWERLGGVLSETPTAVATGPAQLAVIASGGDHRLYMMQGDGYTWGGWQPLGGIVTSAPAAVTTPDGALHLFARGGDQALWHRWFDGVWHDWHSLGGILGSAPTAASTGPGEVDVYARGNDGAAWHLALADSANGWASLGGQIRGAPTAVARNQDVVDVFARAVDDRLFTGYHTEEWSGWEPLGGILTDAPSAARFPDAVPNIDVVARGTDGAAWILLLGQPWSLPQGTSGPDQSRQLGQRLPKVPQKG